MGRVLVALLSLAAGVGAVVAVIALFAARDEGTTDRRPTTGAVDRGAAGPLLRRGNVELVYGEPADAPRLTALVDALGAGDSRELRAAGQAVILRRDPGRSGVLARAWHHTLRARSAGDARLQDFVESWLGAPGSP